MFAVHAQPRVDLLRARVAFVHVQPYAAHAGVGVGQSLHVSVQSFVHASSARFRRDVDALNPPDNAIAPIAPFISNQRRNDDATVLLADQVKAVPWVGKNVGDTLRANLAVKPHVFGLARHGDLKFDNGGRVSYHSRSVVHFGHSVSVLLERAWSCGLQAALSRPKTLWRKSTA